MLKAIIFSTSVYGLNCMRNITFVKLYVPGHYYILSMKYLPLQQQEKEKFFFEMCKDLCNLSTRIYITSKIFLNKITSHEKLFSHVFPLEL